MNGKEHFESLLNDFNATDIKYTNESKIEDGIQYVANIKNIDNEYDETFSNLINTGFELNEFNEYIKYEDFGYITLSNENKMITIEVVDYQGDLLENDNLKSECETVFQEILKNFIATDIKYCNEEKMSDNSIEYVASIINVENYEDFINDIKNNEEYKYDEESNSYITYTPFGFISFEFTDRIVIYIRNENDMEEYNESNSNKSKKLNESGIYPVRLYGGASDAFLKIINEILNGNVVEVNTLELIPSLGYSGGRYWYKANITLDEDTIVNFISNKDTPEAKRLLDNETLIINPYSDISIDCSANVIQYVNGVSLEALSDSDADMKALNNDAEFIGDKIIQLLISNEERILNVLKAYEWDEDVFDDQYESVIPIQEEWDDVELASIYGGDTAQSQKDIAKDELLSTKNFLDIYLNSSINADGFIVEIRDTENKVIYKEKYSYGYNASYDKDFANNEKPFVTDIIKNICKQYDIPKENIAVSTGKNKFNGENVNDSKVNEFKTNYLKDLMLEAFDDWKEPKLGKKIKQLKGWKIYQGTDSSGDEVFRCFTPDDYRPEVGYEDWECETLEQAISWVQNYDLEESIKENNEMIAIEYVTDENDKEELEDINMKKTSNKSLKESKYMNNIYDCLDNIGEAASEYSEEYDDEKLTYLHQIIDLIEDNLKSIKDFMKFPLE